MRRQNLWHNYLIYSIAVLALLFSTAHASGPSNQKSVQGVSIYLGVVPASVVIDHDPEHPERKMHGGTPRDSHYEHVMVALFDEQSGKRITEAEVTAKVSRPGLQPIRKKLEPMAISGAMTFGNYFKMAEDGTYRVEVKISHPGKTGAVKAVFEHEHKYRH
ncbi:MAG: hypothetical protein RI563_09115 [Thiohalophilus sp.]|uniref:hypothetical protein n=1 Tax=Thiohalophilus sp. TaxID=3028392 RepID=UPI002870129B|nr:hypothetical protein [Thiohalophilus sp.]MDR9437031.1 hypothetical protein [Thiohalophilus sp.]